MTQTATRPLPAKPDKPASAMHFTVDRGAFMGALAHAAAIVERRNTVPVLANVLIAATDGALKLTAADLDLQIALAVPATVEAVGATTVSAPTLYSIVRELPGGSQVELKLGDGHLKILSGRSRFSLPVIAPDEFPILQAGEAAASFEAPAADLLRAINLVAFAQSVEESRYYLCGVAVEADDGHMVFAATDGARLSWSRLPVAEAPELDGPILPTKFVASMIELLDGSDATARLSFAPGKALAEIGNAVLTGKLIDGTYPLWRRVVPAPGGSMLLIDGQSLAAAVRRVMILADTRGKAVKIELTRDKLKASCGTPDGGSAVEEMPCVWDAPDLTIGFNGRYLLDLLAAAGEEVQVDLTDAGGPALISNPNDDTAKWVLMPMRV